MKAISTLALLCISLLGARAVTLHVDLIQQNWMVDVHIYGSDNGANIVAAFSINGSAPETVVGYHPNFIIPEAGGVLPFNMVVGLNTVDMTYLGTTYSTTFTITTPTGERPTRFELVGLPDAGATLTLCTLGVLMLGAHKWYWKVTGT